MSPAPTVRHQWISRNIFLALQAYLHTNRQGIVLFAPCDILIQRDPLRTRQPDLFVFLRGRNDIRALETILDQEVLEVAPDITIDILSTSETRRVRIDKIKDYQHIGVKECWIVSPQAQTKHGLDFADAGRGKDGSDQGGFDGGEIS